jgi:hypothetical protein
VGGEGALDVIKVALSEVQVDLDAIEVVLSDAQADLDRVQIDL